MSLSAEALARLEDLDLQEARDGLNFSAAAEGRQSAGADLSSEELVGFRSWDLSGVMARLNGLSFVEPAPMPEPEPLAAPELALDETVAPISDSEGGLPDWLKPAEAVAPPAGAEPSVEEIAEPAPLPEEQPAAPSGPAAEEAEAEVAVADSVAGAGGRMRRFFESEEGRAVLMGTEFAAGGIVGVAIAEILKLGPGREAGIVIAAQSVLGLSRLATEIGARAVEKVENRFTRFSHLSQQLAGEKGLAGVLRGVKTLATRIQYRPFVVGLSVGIIGHSAFEMVAGHSIFPDVNAVEPTPRPAAVSTETPTATATETPTGTPTPDATPSTAPDVTPVPEATQIPDGREVGGSDWRGGHAEHIDESGKPISGLEPSAEQPPVEQVGPQHPGVGQLPGGETAVIPAEDLVPQPGDAEVLVQQAAAQSEVARQAALEVATRVVEVQPGDTLTGLLDAAGSIDPYGVDFTNTVLQSADVLTGPQNPNRDMAQALIEFIKAHPDGVNWRDAINGVGDLAKEMVGGVPLKDAIAQATRMIYPGQEMKIVVGAGIP